ncbi:hypothetical protein GCM10007916_32450 [Psychromonas marina]|uniref:Uncharacterized protein n=1 Tax=Psychromonas marina TaxID=88364 RepID=A0ABQ6E4X6_9GAMM|nr:DUF6776 family protein [Psychromonas marina]GLS92175.1 hypothetical protein GCM10007916_32450 [Psychromonas marina]
MKRLRNSFVKWLVVSLMCLLLGFLLGKFKQDILDEQLSVVNSELQAVQARNNSLATEFSRIQVNSESEQQTIKSLLHSNKQLQDELAAANNKLFFYERVIAPELETTGMKVYSFSVVKNELTEQWDYELVLMQSQKDRRFLTGKFDISFSVFEEEKLKTIKLSELTEELQSSFKFKYFQTIQGSFSLSDEVTVDEVILQLSVAGNRWYKAQNIEERYDWRVLTTKDISTLSEFDNADEQ